MRLVNIWSVIGVLLPSLFGSASSEDVELIYAAGRGDLVSINRHVASGANLNAVALDSLTPLVNAISKKQLGASRLLLQLGADPNKLSGDLSPLFFAFMRCDIAMIGALQAHGARLIMPSAVNESISSTVESCGDDQVKTAFRALAR